MTATSEKYTKVAIALHWVIAILMIFMLFFSEDLIKVPRGSSLADWGPTAHASIGLLILLLSVVRIGWRLSNPPPPLPTNMPYWQVMATQVSHAGFYLLLIAIPLLGWFAMAPYAAEHTDPQAVTFFKLFAVDIMPDIGGWTIEAHDIVGKLAMFLLFLHVLAALKHQFIDKDGLMRRMMFR